MGTELLKKLEIAQTHMGQGEADFCTKPCCEKIIFLIGKLTKKEIYVSKMYPSDFMMVTDIG